MKIDKCGMWWLLYCLNLKNQLGLIYYLLPFIFAVKNRFGLIFSILIGSDNYKIKLDENMVVNFKSSQFDTMLSLLGLLTYSTSYAVKSEDKIELCLDTKNKFTVTLGNLSIEDTNLLLTLFDGMRHGANFVTEDNMDFNDYRDKTLKIIKRGNKKIIETSNGIKFYMDSINPGNTIAETFVMQIHRIHANDDWNNRIVIDVGAECGDTPLYYASMGATVYAFEPIKAHFDAMLRNLSLNPELSKRIIPINAAIGKDGILKFYHSNLADIRDSSSFVYNVHGNNAQVLQVKGYSLEVALKEFNINHVDLLKMDCKGCEFFLTENDLKNVDKVKIEYEAFPYVSHNLEELLMVLEKSGFEYMIYRSNPNRDSFSNKLSGHLYGRKILR